MRFRDQSIFRFILLVGSFGKFAERLSRRSTRLYIREDGVGSLKLPMSHPFGQLSVISGLHNKWLHLGKIVFRRKCLLDH